MTTQTKSMDTVVTFHKKYEPDELLKVYPDIKEKIKQEVESIINNSVFKDKIKLIVTYYDIKCPPIMGMYINNRTHSDRNYTRKYKGLLRDLNVKLSKVHENVISTYANRPENSSLVN